MKQGFLRFKREDTQHKFMKAIRATLRFLNFSAYFYSLLNSHQQKKTEITQIAIVLDHLYSKGTLSPERLKARDKNLYSIFSSSPKFQVSVRPLAFYFEGQIHKACKGNSGSDSGNRFIENTINRM